MNDYHLDYDSQSKTMLTLFCKSRLEYKLTYVTREMQPWVPTKPALAGTILHAVLLEDKAFEDCVLPYPAECLKCNGDLNGKVAAKFREDNPEIICLKEPECEALREVVRGVMAHVPLGQVIKAATNREERFDAVVDDVPCRCKPDILCDLGDKIVVYDLKFSELVDPGSFRRANRRLRYWLQDAHYSRCLAERFGKPVVFRFCVVEVKFPYRVCWYWLDPISRDNAFDAHKKILADLKECQLTGNWDDKWPSEVVLSPWDLDTEEASDYVEIA